MLKKFIFQSKKIYPSIILDKEKGIFEISGRSLPEDADNFYTEIIEWIQEYIKEPNENTEFVFKLDYYNSSTARKISDILVLLEKILESEKKIQIHWYYQEGDEVMKESGEDFELIMNIPFEFKEIP